MRPRRLSLMGAALLVAALTASACGTRVDREAIAAAERGGLQVAAGAVPAPSANGVDPGSADGTGSGSAQGALAPTEATGPSGRPDATLPAAPSGATSAGSSAEAPTRTAVTTAPSPSAKPRPSPPGAPLAPGPSAPAPPSQSKALVAVGTVATLSGPVGAFVKDSVFAVGVWAKWMNGKGGINGHAVRHVVADDGGDPARYNAAVRQMTEEQGAIAFLHNTIGFAGGDFGYITQKRMPVIGHEGGIDAAYESPFVFTPAPSGATYAYSAANAFASVAVPAGKKKLAVLACSDVKLCDTFDKVLTGPETKALGFELVYHARPSLTQPDFTGECISARQAGAEIIVQTLDNNSMLRVARSCARQNYHPLWGYFDNVTLPSVAQDPNTDGAIVAVKAPPWVSKDLPGLAEIHQAFAEAAPGVEVNGAHVNGWVSAKTFEVAARNLPDKPTNEDVLNGLWSIKGDNLGGLTYPLSFPKMGNSPKKACWSTVVIKNKAFVATQGSALSCKD